MMIIYSAFIAVTVAVVGTLVCTSGDGDRAAAALSLIDSGKN